MVRRMTAALPGCMKARAGVRFETYTLGPKRP